MDGPPLDVAIRLADEGVPLRAIARATKTSSSDMRQWLQEAQAEGRLLEIPHEDWPPGFPRDQRALQLSRLTTENKNALLLATRRTFKLTYTQAMILLALVQSAELAKLRLDMAAKTVDVHLYALRKLLEPCGIKIETLWGYGYKLSVGDRHKVMDIILQQVSAGL